MAEATPARSMAELAAEVRSALDSADTGRFEQLLAPDVQWGAPGDPDPPCRSRRDVIRWYERGRQQGRRGRVVDVAVHGDRLVVHLRVRDESGPAPGREEDRWQVLACADGQVRDIRGHESAAEALDAARRP